AFYPAEKQQVVEAIAESYSSRDAAEGHLRAVALRPGACLADSLEAKFKQHRIIGQADPGRAGPSYRNYAVAWGTEGTAGREPRKVGVQVGRVHELELAGIV